MEILVAIAGILIPTLLWIYERVSRVSAERELDQTRRRSAGPYFRPSDIRFDSLNERMIHPMMGSVLCWMREQVAPETPVNELVWLLVDNLGAACHEIRVTLGSDRLEVRNTTTNNGQRVLAIGYNFNPGRRGKDEQLYVDFLASDGVIGRHKYTMIHGLRHLHRVDPAGLDSPKE